MKSWISLLNSENTAALYVDCCQVRELASAVASAKNAGVSPSVGAE
jgi:hypothetical protein